MSDSTEVLTADRPVAGSRDQPVAVMRSPISAHHQQRGATFAIEDGWEVPRLYQDIERERTAIRESLAIGDITARGKIDIRGAVESPLAALPQTRGATLARVSRNWALVFTPPAGLAGALTLMESLASRETMVTDATSIYAGIALLGPRVPDLLSRLTAVDPSTLLPGHCLATQLLRLPAILLRRELPTMVVETYLPSEFANYAWEAIFAVAHPLAPEAAGLDALRAEGWR
jgi:glycine cleavage system aminomethyltransferase T